MNKIATISALALGLSASLFAAQFKGFVEDQMCSGIAAMKGNAECAQKCTKAGSPAVLMMADGKIYKIANQDKMVPMAGKNVTVTGKLVGDTITVDSVK